MARVNRYKQDDLKNILGKRIFTNFGSSATDRMEMHVYGAKTLIDSEYNERYQTQQYDNIQTPHISMDIHNQIREFGYTKGRYTVVYNFFRNILGEYDYPDGLFISEISATRTEVRVTTISRDSKFLSMIREFTKKTPESERKVDKKGDTSYESDISTDIINGCLDDLLLNFGGNRTAVVTNWTFDGEEGGGIIFKLYKPLDKEFQVNAKFWLVKEVISSLIQSIKLVPIEEKTTSKATLHPNFELNIPLKVGESSWQSWDDILGNNKSTKQSLMNSFVSKSNSQAHENVDYTHYKNFVHFSSATERLENFKYKLRLLEQYSSSLKVLNAMPTATTYGDTNISEYERKVQEVKNGFDGYENFMYYKSSSYISSSIEETFPKTWPKTTHYEPYVNAKVDDAAAVTWFTSQSNVALDWDTVKNEHNLENTIPFHIREDKANSNYLLFTNMVGQHYDHVWGYLSQSLQIHKRQNPLYEGLSKDLVYNVLASLGWESYQGFHFQDLWEYSLGLDKDGAYGAESASWKINSSSYSTAGGIIPSSASVLNIYASPQQQSGSISREEMSRETWKRMLNNLPYLLKTKGSERGIKALVATYGLPPTLLRVFEYGGPQKRKSADSYVSYDKFGYSLEFTGSQYLRGTHRKLNNHILARKGGVGVSRTPDAYEMRFNTWTPTSQSLVQWGSYPNAKCNIGIVPHPSASNKNSGYYNFGSVTAHFDGTAVGSSSYLPIYDNDWWNVMVTRASASYNGSNHMHLAVAKAADHSNNRITHTASLYIPNNESGTAASWNKPLAMYVGRDYYGYNNFSGSIQEIRTWILPESNTVAIDEWNTLHQFHNHTRDPLQIEAYGATGSYNQLVQRWSLGADLNRWSGSWLQADQGLRIISSSAPSARKRKDPFDSGNLTHLDLIPYGFECNLAVDWPTEEEKYYTAMPDLVGTRHYSDKTRIESSELVSRLDNRKKSERSQFDSAPLDSNRLGVYFAPNFEIDLDIARELGGAKFGNYVGNPLDYRDNEYKRLRVLRQHYWYKHDNPFSFHEYIKILRHLDYTLFDQIERILPARANAQVGLLVNCNMLERPKVKSLAAEKLETTYDGFIDTSFYHVKGATTTLGGPMHQWFDPKTNKWESGHTQAGTQAINAQTGIWPEHIGPYGVATGSSQGSADQSEGELVIRLDTRTHYGHNLEDEGSRYIWRYMHQWKSNHTLGQGSKAHTKGTVFNNTTAWIQQAGASYENNYEFYTDKGDGVNSPDSWNNKHLRDVQTTASIIAPNIAFKHRYDQATNRVPTYQGRWDSPNLLVADAYYPAYPGTALYNTKDNFQDFGNIKNYHNQRLSRVYSKQKYYYMSPKNNMHNSASTGDHHETGMRNGWTSTEMSNGWYRSGIRPVSKSYEAAEAQDYKCAGFRRLFYEGCKLVGSDFNMPVLSTIDGGPVVEVTDTNPNAIIISNRSGNDGDLRATGQTMQRSI